jgi:hypothetical protein
MIGDSGLDNLLIAPISRLMLAERQALRISVSEVGGLMWRVVHGTTICPTIWPRQHHPHHGVMGRMPHSRCSSVMAGTSTPNARPGSGRRAGSVATAATAMTPGTPVFPWPQSFPYRDTRPERSLVAIGP